jgi:hypothetical protein
MDLHPASVRLRDASVTETQHSCPVVRETSKEAMRGRCTGPGFEAPPTSPTPASTGRSVGPLGLKGLRREP